MKTLLIVLAMFCLTAAARGQEVKPVPEGVRRDFKIDAFYEKHIDALGVPVIGSKRVSDAALREAAWIVRHALDGRQWALGMLAERRVCITVLAVDEYTTDLPGYRDRTPAIYWDRAFRGLGDASIGCGEENLLGYRGDPSPAQSVLLHRLADALLKDCPEQRFRDRLSAAFAKARKDGLWKWTDAVLDVEHYWAEGVLAWFEASTTNDEHAPVATRDKLKAYDPQLAEVCREMFGDGEWRYRRPADRAEADRAHLADLPAAEKRPVFKWREVPVPENPRVIFQTELGVIEVELDAKRAPLSANNQLRYVDGGFFTDGSFFRTVKLKPDNQPNNTVKIQVIQAQANPAREKEFFAPIKMERTRDTGIRHLDGTLSMARDGPDTAQDSFSICVGDQPNLDFGSLRNPDGQGFAAFGHVVQGMDVVRKIHQSPVKEQTLTPPIRIIRAVRSN